MSNGSEILAYTCTYGDRQMRHTVRSMRAQAGCWFDWAVFAGATSEKSHTAHEKLLNDPDRLGIQYLCRWEENRGQHHATKAALALAKAREYKWLLRIDDDVTARTNRWLKTMVDQLEHMKTESGDDRYRIVASPRVVGLKNPLHPSGAVERDYGFPVEVMAVLGGACRLHPVALLSDFEPDLFAPVGRTDPQQVAQHVEENDGLLVRFPNIRVNHKTVELEKKDTPEQAHQRRMGWYWPWLHTESES